MSDGFGCSAAPRRALLDWQSWFCTHAQTHTRTHTLYWQTFLGEKLANLSPLQSRAECVDGWDAQCKMRSNWPSCTTLIDHSPSFSPPLSLSLPLLSPCLLSLTWAFSWSSTCFILKCSSTCWVEDEHLAFNPQNDPSSRNKKGKRSNV